jgi:tight adherence protein B
MTPDPGLALTATPVLAAALGAGAGVGLLLVVIGVRGVDPQRPRRSLIRRRLRGPDGSDGRVAVLRFAVSVAAGVLSGVATGWVVGAVLVGLACWSLPRMLGRDPGHARRLARIEAIATWTEMLRDTLSAASGLEQAILATAPLAPPAIRVEITGLAARLQAGDRLAPALRATATELGDPTGDLALAALVLAAERQARQLADLLGSLAQTAREQASMRMRVEAGRARSRTSVRVIVGTTLVFAVGMVLLNRSFLSAYDSAAGQIVLLGLGVLFTLGFTWLTRIAALPEPTRFLSLTSEPTSTENGRDTAVAAPTGSRAGVTIR